MRSRITTKKRVWLAPLLAVSLITVTACGSETTNEGGEKSGQSVRLTGAGASFPAPLYQRWFKKYNEINPNVEVEYQSVGSGAGIEQFTQKTVDFGASDVAMNDEQIAAIERGVILLPMTAGSIVLAYNLPGVDELKLSRDTYVNILLGKITKWNDPAIAKDNKGVKLPEKEITVVHRSDGSGTTGVFTKHLSAISEDWKNTIGEGKSVQWPSKSSFVGAKGNEGVTAQVKNTEGAIGYLEFGYAKQQGIPYASLENQSGQFVTPSTKSASDTLKAVKLPDNLRAFITDPEGAESYPIVTYTWILAYQKYEDQAKVDAFKEVVTWALTDGQKVSEELGYIPLPENVVEKVKESLEKIEVKK